MNHQQVNSPAAVAVLTLIVAGSALLFLLSVCVRAHIHRFRKTRYANKHFKTVEEARRDFT